MPAQQKGIEKFKKQFPSSSFPLIQENKPLQEIDWLFGTFTFSGHMSASAGYSPSYVGGLGGKYSGGLSPYYVGG
ncbi:hypothetical protein P8452_06097 [Trifolium repens]|nr:hypothetical protein P8452_06097 [Trifolium repens]